MKATKRLMVMLVAALMMICCPIQAYAAGGGENTYDPDSVGLIGFIIQVRRHHQSKNRSLQSLQSRKFGAQILLNAYKAYCKLTKVILQMFLRCSRVF